MMLHGGMFVKMIVLTDINKYSQHCFEVHCTEISSPGNTHSAKVTTYLVHKKKRKKQKTNFVLLYKIFMQHF